MTGPPAGPRGGPPYDEDERRTAAAIARQRPHWLVMWGPGSRRYWAFPCFGVPPGTLVSATSPDELLAAMDATELAARPGPPFPGGPGLPGG